MPKLLEMRMNSSPQLMKPLKICNDAEHFIKNFVSNTRNWMLIDVDRNIFSLRILKHLTMCIDPTIREEVIHNNSKQSLVWKDKPKTSCALRNISQQNEDLLFQIKIFVGTAIPETVCSVYLIIT